MRWILIVALAGCSAKMRYPGPLDSLADYGGLAPAPQAAPPPAAQPQADAPDVPDDPRRLEDVLAMRRRARGPDARAEEIVDAAIDQLERTRMVVDGEVYRHDCIGFVEAAYASLDVDLTSSISLLKQQAIHLGVFHRDPHPLPGDIVFFDNSYDKNRNGVRDDPNTHVAIVERVDEDGTIHMIHLGGRGKPVTRKIMNVLHPNVTRSEEGKVWNSHLRSTRDRDGGPTLTAQLWTGFASVWKVSEEDLTQAAAALR